MLLVFHLLRRSESLISHQHKQMRESSKRPGISLCRPTNGYLYSLLHKVMVTAKETLVLATWRIAAATPPCNVLPDAHKSPIDRSQSGVSKL